MKIALLTPGGVDRSGTERVIPCLLWLIERLVAAGDEVHVFAAGQEPKPGRWPLLGATVHNAGRRPQSLTSLAMMTAERLKAPFDVIHAFWANGGGVTGAVAAKLFRRPLVLTLPGGDVACLPAIGYGDLTRWDGRLRVSLACAGAKVITAPSRATCALAAERLGIEARYLPLGVAIDRWPPAPPRRRDPAAPIRLLHIASLNRVKDQRTLLGAMALLRQIGVRFELDIVGEDTLGGAMQRRAAELGLGNLVRFAGYVPFQALRPWVDRADLLVMSSLHEAGPLVTLEAAVAGVPTAGTAVGHIVDFAPDAALAAPVGDAPALADIVRRLASDEGLRLRLAAASQARALACDADYTAREFRKLYVAACSAKAVTDAASEQLDGPPAVIGP